MTEKDKEKIAKEQLEIDREQEKRFRDKETPDTDDDDKNEDEETSPIDEAKEILKQIKEQNKELAANLKRAEKITADSLLGGRSKAGQQQITQEQKEILEARKLLEGTGFEDKLFPVAK